MSKDLEQFIRDHRQEMNDYEPGEKVWKSLEKEFSPSGSSKKKTGRLEPLRWAAAAAAIIIIAATAYFLVPVKKETALSKAESAELPREYADAVFHFTRLIELKHKELLKVASEQPELYRQFAGDITKLDSSYQVLKRALPNNPNQEVLLQAMIGNLKWQIDLLNEQLIIIQKIKTIKKTSHEKLYKSA